MIVRWETIYDWSSTSEVLQFTLLSRQSYGLHGGQTADKWWSGG